MIVTAIVLCEVAFWLVLAAGFALRYVAGRRRLSGLVLAGVPLLDVGLLVLTVADLRAGAPPRNEHGLAAVYLGCSVVLGPSVVRWADARAAHRWAAGPRPPGRPPGGTRARVRAEWREYGRVAAAGGLSALLLLGLTGVAGDGTGPLLVAWLSRIGMVLAIWLLVGPLWETGRALVNPAGLSGTRPADPNRARRPRGRRPGPRAGG